MFHDLLAVPAVWGLLSGLHGLVSAYFGKDGTPEGRRQA